VQENNPTRVRPASVSAALAAARAEASATLAAGSLAAANFSSGSFPPKGNLSSGSLASGDGAGGVRFPAEDGGRSLAEMAQRDLDAALQLLADRAQYITGAGGAAIALRLGERNEMLCRASSGAKAPQLGALLSTESGLSGESVRTRMPLRCDDAEHDPRVNQESCRDLGIASVMIVPIMGEDRLGQGQVLGVFELFSGQADAFAERDLSALQRLGGMVETAVKLARAAEGTLPEMVAPDQTSEDQIQEITTEGTGEHRVATGVLESAAFADEAPVLEVEMDEAVAELPSEATVAATGVEAARIEAAKTATPAVQSDIPVLPRSAIVADVPAVVAAAPSAIPPVGVSTIVVPSIIVPSIVVPASVVPAKEQPAKRPLMWSAAVHPSPDAPKPMEADQSHVPPMLRSLRKCKACGFPVSEGRTLCVECDEKQWRGQPLSAAAAAKTPVARPAVDFRQGASASAPGSNSVQPKAASASAPAPVSAVRPSASPAVAAVTPFVSSSATPSGSPNNPSSGPAAAPAPLRLAPQNLAAALAELNEQQTRVEAARRGVPVAMPVVVPAEAVEPSPRAAVVSAAVSAPVPAPSGEISGLASAKPAEVPEGKAAVEPVREIAQNPASLNFSGGLGSSESWLGANKYILGAILVIAAVVAGIVWLR